MKRIVVIIIWIAFMSNLAFAADKYEVGDQLYVWAKNGLNVRTGAGTDFDVLTKVNFGDKITVLEKTDKSYKLAAITKVSLQYTDGRPLYFDGNWVKVKTESGEEGYVIDQYLLRLKPFKENSKLELNLKLLHTDTFYIDKHQSTSIRHIGLNLYEHGITHSFTLLEKESKESYYLPDFTIEEAMILFNYYWDNDEQILFKSDKNEIHFGPDYGCESSFKYKNGLVVVESYCSC